MYPLDAVYGHCTYRTFEREKNIRERSLKGTRERADQIFQSDALVASRYTDLIEIVSFLSVMNKRHTLYFRGQGEPQRTLLPAIFRSSWTSLSGVQHNIPDDPQGMEQIWRHLNNEITEIVLSVCSDFRMPRPNTLPMFREAVWAVAQHYSLWPTPLIDITPNLRVAASFALWGGRSRGHLYIVALPASTNSVTFDADQHIALARLQAVCPPVAKRPHYQDGFLAGRFPFMSPVSNRIDKDPGNVSRLERRLIAHIALCDEEERGGFWSKDFPRMSEGALLPDKEHDDLLRAFSKHGDSIDNAMRRLGSRARS